MLQKQNLNINFAQGLDTKTDPFQVQPGKFLELKNTIFTKGGLLKKRNGYGQLPTLPESASYSTTFNGDLTVVGSSIQVLSSGTDQWVNKGKIQPLELSTLPLIRNNLNQTQVDSAIAANGSVCTVFTETNGSINSFKYVIADSISGQNIVAPTVISAAEPTYGAPRVFLLGNYFVIVYTSIVTAVYHLDYIAINTSNPTIVTSPVTISTSYTPSTRVNFDGVVLNDSLYFAWNGASSSGIKMAYLTASLSLSSVINPDASHVATIMSVCADTVNNVVWASYYNSGSSTGYSLAVSSQLALLAHFPTQIISSGTILNIASVAASGVATVFYETSNTATSIQTNFVSSVTVTQSTGVVSSPVVVLRSVGLASKAFFVDGTIYFLSAYSSTYQPTYFLVNGSLSRSSSPNVIAKLAYENGGGYLATGLPSVSVSETTAFIPYLIKDLVQALSDSNSEGTAVVGGVYSQTGINIASFNIGSQGVLSSEIGSNLNINGGFLWAYDGYSVVEQGFHLFPDSVQSTATATTGGSLAAQIYYYQVTYEWTDNQGNAFRSAGSIPVLKDISSSVTATNTITLVIPTLRVTAKVSNAVKIVVYRWSTAQQTFYQTTSISVPTLNSTTADSVTYVDTHSDASILGNNILYTTGGVIENIGGSAFKNTFLFDDRLFGIYAEDPNLIGFSKQVIESTPVEMSDLLTIYVAPNIGAQGPSGPLNCGFPMDDKAILFKSSSILYINGSGPDNTGANSQYSQPIFVTSTVGCSNQKSIVLIPSGLMFEFQSEAGNQIWLLGRDLSTQYIGAPVESLTSGATVQSAVNIPGTNQVRFTMSSGVTLMYDYYYGQWGTFVNVPATSSTLYQGLHTYINDSGQVFQESPGVYLDGSRPVLMGFTTSWLNLAGLQGYLRSYFFYLLGKYITPFKLVCSIAYDYNPSPTQSTTITPTNFAPYYGGAESNGQDTVYGQDSPYGGPGDILNWRVFLSKQRCSSFQISIQEYYDSSFGVTAGEGLTLSGINLVYALKKGFRPISSAQSAGSS